jgi:hypothetical protein
LQSDKIIDYLSWTLLFVAILLLKATSSYVENIIHGRKFVWYYLLIGLVIASLWMFVLYKLKRNYFDGGEKRASAVLSQFFGIIVLTIFLNAFYTYQTGKTNLYHKTAVLQDKGHNLKSGADFLHLVIDGRKERFKAKPREYKNLVSGDSLILTIGKGKTGYEFIYKFEKK